MSTTSAIAVRLPVLGDPPQVTVAALPPAGQEPAAGERRVDLRVGELQPLDLQIARGQLPGVPAGIQPGSSAVARTADGARVAVLGGAVGLGTSRPGCFATWFDVPDEAVVTIPDGVEDEVVAAGLSAALTAIVALDDHARLRAGERVLVLGATGAVGRAAVGLALAAGAEVVALARDAASRTALPAGVSLAELDLLTTADARAELGAVDVVVDTLGGPWTAAAARLGAPRCRHVLLGYAAGASATLVVPALLANEHRFLALNLHATPLTRLAEVAVTGLDALVDGVVSPEVGPRVALHDAARAYELVASGGRPLLVPA